MDKKYEDLLKTEATKFHMKSPRGKIQTKCSKQLRSAYELALAYSPGAADACMLIQHDKKYSSYLTNKDNLVAVISNGTAVLGLGNIGADASKPVMEGKSAIFKTMSDLDSIDIEINESDPQKLAEIICAISPSFGGINLEDIKAPDCFIVEDYVKKNTDIPIMHDDQHGTAIVACAAIKNALRIQKKSIENVKTVMIGAGAASIATAKLLLNLGMKKENLWMADNAGIIYNGRSKAPNEWQKDFARPSLDYKTPFEALENADIMIGLAVGNIVAREDVAKMAKNPIIFSLANPVPEISKSEVLAVKPDAIYASGRSDDINQVNNIICFPYMFRGAVDAEATYINEEMKKACVEAIAAEGIKLIHNVDSIIDTPAVNTVTLIPRFTNHAIKINVPLAVFSAAKASGSAKTSMTVDEYREKLISKFNVSFSAKEVQNKKNVITFSEYDIQKHQVNIIAEACNPTILTKGATQSEHECFQYFAQKNNLSLNDVLNSSTYMAIAMCGHLDYDAALINANKTSYFKEMSKLKISKKAYVANNNSDMFVFVSDPSLIPWAKNLANFTNTHCIEYQAITDMQDTSQKACHIVPCSSENVIFAEHCTAHAHQNARFVHFINEKQIIFTNGQSTDIRDILYMHLYS